MVDGINFNAKVGQVGNINKTTTVSINNTSPPMGTFGYGFKTNNTGFERNLIPPELLAKFENLEIPKYTKNIPNLTISDKDYIPDEIFRENAYCEV